MGPDISAQERLERASLANARALVEKLEDRDRHPYRGVWRHAVVAIVLVAAGGAAAAWLLAPDRLPDTSSMTASQYADHALGRLERFATSRASGVPIGADERATFRLTITPGGFGQIDYVRGFSSTQLDESFARLDTAFGPAPGGRPFALTAQAHVRRPDSGRATIAIHRLPD